ncbi:germin-like protein 1-1 [Selaginella moellendorffii]|uniref:germin-like protein 1-1 n=1 Tax=Selaginella moellendorffii TaxID=88036 RepID=UPI000D1C56E4|nr:germin-like protein 1-1 [Selaginella moellendorffii]|eukprot:XP_024519900.1 germin-like protein 1-1 [Selaginella moellendorffii]
MASSLQVLLVFFSVLADSTDPGSLQDYCLPTQEQQHQCKSSPSPSDFVSKVLGNTTNTRPPQTWNATLLSSANFPALNTMDLTIARAELGVGGTVPLHYHPRASELVFIAEGVVEVGFVDTSNVLFIQTLQLGDVTIVPKGMLHYEYNPGSSRATLLAYSQSPGILAPGHGVFGSGIRDEVIAASLGGLDHATLEAVKAKFKPRL